MMSPFACSLYFIISVTVFGALVDVFLAGVAGGETPAFRLRKTPLYFALGAAVYTVPATLLSINGVKLSVMWFLALVVLALALNVCVYPSTQALQGLRSPRLRSGQAGQAVPALLRGRGERPDAPLKPLKFWTGMSNIFVFAVIAAIAVLVAWKTAMKVAVPSFGIDLMAHLLIKAKILLHTTIKDSIFFHDPLFAHMHVKYPPMFAVFYNLLFLFMGGAFNGYYHVVNGFILFLTGYAVYGFLAERIPRPQAALWFFIFVSAWYYVGSNLMEGSDLFLSLFFLVAAIELFRFIAGGRLYNLLTCAVTAAGGALMKNEGLMFAVFIFFILAACRAFSPGGMRRAVREASLFLVVVAVMVLAWLVYRTGLPEAGLFHLKMIREAGFVEYLPYLAATSSVFFGNLLSPIWSGVFILWAVMCIVFIRYCARSGALVFALLALGQLAVYFTIFWLTDGAVIRYNFSASGLTRVISHCYPLALMTAALITGERVWGRGREQRA
ncbi:MAG: hypothetical protein ABIH74_00320 [Candidatus Omnitrophota bacterium]